MKQLFDINAAAQLLSISPWTVRRAIKTRSLEAVRIGRRVLLEEESLERFVSDAKRSCDSAVEENLSKEQQELCQKQ